MTKPTTIEFTGFETKHLTRNYGVDGRGRADFTYIDPDGRRLHTVLEELTVSEQTCEGPRIAATLGLPDPGTEAAFLLVNALLKAMDMDEDYALAARHKNT